MAINVYGLPDTVGGVAAMPLARLQDYEYIKDSASWREGVSDLGSGLATSPTGTRGVQVNTGKAAVPGLLVDVTTTQNVTCAANGAGNPRIDLIVLRVTTSGGSATKTAGGTIAVVQGTAGANPVAPTPTQTLGGTWEMALARATIAPSASSVTLEDCRPAPLGQVNRAAAADFNLASIDGSSAGESLAAGITGGLSDPGRPYRVLVVAEFAVNDSRTLPTTGHTNFFLYFNGNKVATFKNDTGNSNSASLSYLSAPISGRYASVSVSMKPIAVPSGSTITLDTTFCQLAATVLGA